MRWIFFIMFLVLVLGTVGYVLWHVWCLLPISKIGRWLVTVLMAACVLSMFILFGGVLERIPLNTASLLYDVSTSSLIIFLYLFITFLVLDVLRLVRLLPSRLLHDNWWMTIGITVVMLVIFICGNIHYNNKVRVPLSLTTDKPLKKEYKVVMVSDLHLGYHNRREELARWVDLLNAENPDFILIGGDIIDNSTRPLLEDHMAEEFHRLKAPVYACLGNHEYFSNELKAKKFYQDTGIRLLVDDVATVDSVITIIGRDDRFNRNRKSLEELVRKVDLSTYTIVIDHQPYELEKTEQCKVDFQFSGHTHRGQVWPISWITDAVYECSFGPWQRGDTKFYVSSGLGIWGGKFRIGTQSEYIVATIGH